MSNLSQAVAMLGPAAFMTGIAALLLPPVVTVRRNLPGRRPEQLRSNFILGLLLGAIVAAVCFLALGPQNPNAALEILYLLGGFIAIAATLAALATLVGAAVYRARHPKTK